MLLIVALRSCAPLLAGFLRLGVVHPLEGADLDGVAQRCACAVALEAVVVQRREFGFL